MVPAKRWENRFLQSAAWLSFKEPIIGVQRLRWYVIKSRLISALSKIGGRKWAERVVAAEAAVLAAAVAAEALVEAAAEEVSAEAAEEEAVEAAVGAAEAAVQ